VELFFKWIKQNLRIKNFLGTSKNAVMTKICIAIITMLLFAYYEFRAMLSHSLSQILKLLQLNFLADEIYGKCSIQDQQNTCCQIVTNYH